jgi:hypothetical protein
MRLHLFLLALIACSTPPAFTSASTLPVEHAGPPILQMLPAVSGHVARARLVGAPPGSDVGFVIGASVQAGATCPSAISPLCLDMAAPVQLLGTATTNASGVATLQASMPATITGFTYVQAVIHSTGAVRVLPPEIWQVLDPGVDSDEDGLLNELEVEFLTDATNPDTDGGGVCDGQELLVDGTNPRSDGDDLGYETSCDNGVDDDDNGVWDCDDISCSSAPECRPYMQPYRMFLLSIFGYDAAADELVPYTANGVDWRMLHTFYIFDTSWAGDTTDVDHYCVVQFSEYAPKSNAFWYTSVADALVGLDLDVHTNQPAENCSFIMDPVAYPDVAGLVAGMDWAVAPLSGLDPNDEAYLTSIGVDPVHYFGGALLGDAVNSLGLPYVGGGLSIGYETGANFDIMVSPTGDWLRRDATNVIRNGALTSGVYRTQTDAIPWSVIAP